MPDVRLVVHWTLPATPEAYYQEAGRELYRLRGELLAASGASTEEVRGVFQEAIDVATRQGATALVRRAERSLQHC
jgi:hypothetical protein